jgi:hypothetical protein
MSFRHIRSAEARLAARHTSVTGYVFDLTGLAHVLPFIWNRIHEHRVGTTRHAQVDCGWRNLEVVAVNARSPASICHDDLIAATALRRTSGNVGHSAELSDAKTNFYFKHTMPDVSIFAHVGCGCVLLGTDQPVDRIALLEVGIRLSAEFAIAPCTSVL